MMEIGLMCRKNRDIFPFVGGRLKLLVGLSKPGSRRGWLRFWAVGSMQAIVRHCVSKTLIRDDVERRQVTVRGWEQQALSHHVAGTLMARTDLVSMIR